MERQLRALRTLILLLLLTPKRVAYARRHLPQDAKEAFKPPKYFFVFGERRSGASYLSELIRTNVDPHLLVDCYIVTHHVPESEKAKHAPSHHHQHANARRPDTHHLPNLDEDRDPTFPRHALVTKRSLEQMQCPVDETLFVYVTKDPYAWVNSMASRKTGGPPRRTVVRTIVAEKFKTVSESYGSLLQMRYDKIQASLKLRDSVKHFSHVRYEDFLEDAEVNLSELLQKFGIRGRPQYHGVYHATRGEKRTPKGLVRADHTSSVKFGRYRHYVEKKFLDLYDTKLMDFVTARMDAEVESKVRKARGAKRRSAANIAPSHLVALSTRRCAPLRCAPLRCAHLRCECPGPRSETMSNNVTDTSLFASRFASLSKAQSLSQSLPRR